MKYHFPAPHGPMSSLNLVTNIRKRYIMLVKSRRSLVLTASIIIILLTLIVPVSSGRVHANQPTTCDNAIQPTSSIFDDTESLDDNQPEKCFTIFIGIGSQLTTGSQV